MNLVLFLLVGATAINGLLAGLNLDTVLVKLPARQRIGVVTYAAFARGNDLGNGLVVYPLLGVGAALLTVLATLFAFVSHGRMDVVLLLSLATLLSLLHTFATARAAPIMLSLKNTSDGEALLAAKLDRFARWHMVRATLQVLAFFILLWALSDVDQHTSTRRKKLEGPFLWMFCERSFQEATRCQKKTPNKKGAIYATRIRATSSHSPCLASLWSDYHAPGGDA